ncbi:MAG: hypothetical protein LBB64_01410 [Dysgonamonadaceae bacterium]|jgi:hypothetical protein|nr:hypothetical protein [Dysgonamonadaceae bacterium]
MKRWATLFLCIWAAVGAPAQTSPTEITYSVMDLLALRHYPFRMKADTVVENLFARYAEPADAKGLHQRTTVQLVTDKDFLDGQIRSMTSGNAWLYKQLLAPYHPWLPYFTPLKAGGREVGLPIGWQENGQCEALYDFLGKENVHFLIDELTEESGLFRPSIAYHSFFAGTRRIDGQEVYEIAFYPENPRKDAFTGYLYITPGARPDLVKAVYTRSNLYTATPIRKVLWTQTFGTAEGKTIPVKKEAVFTWGDIVRGSLLVKRSTYYTDSIEPLTPAEQQITPFVRTAGKTRAFRNLKNLIHLAMTDRLIIGGPDGPVEWGPVTQSISYNAMEGFRLRAGGNTTLQLNPHFLVGGYLAYGTTDRQFKYRADGLYSLLPKDLNIWEFPKRLFSFSYVRDLNMPGQDLMDNRRDVFYRSFTYSGTHDMSLQKMATASYEHEWKNRWSFRIGGRYWNEQPEGKIQYDAITTSEIQLSLRYAPGELFLQSRDDRIYLSRSGVEWNFRHRIGLKDVLGSDYRYHISDFSLRKRWYLPRHAGYGDVRFSAGKVWNRVPFPLLFIPKANQSYEFSTTDYNRMQIYEFVTDRFAAGQVDFQFNWSPFQWFSRSSIRTTWGVKALYGPLSDMNRPALSSESFPFPTEVRSLNHTPYVEMHFGFTNILNVLRIEWVQRMTYAERGALLFGVSL